MSANNELSSGAMPDNRLCLPAQVKIGAHQFKVVETVFKERQDVYAQYDWPTMEIRIERKGPQGPRANSCVLESFVHELLHLADITGGHPYLWNTADREKENNIDGLSERIAAILVDNGWVKP